MLFRSRDDTERRRRWLNGRATVEALLAHGVVPIVNENDTVATEEIRYGDNDRLAARTAQLARADLLILLSDVDGLYTADPRRDPAARHRRAVCRPTQCRRPLCRRACRWRNSHSRAASRRRY